jgi:hypothetical protein
MLRQRTRRELVGGAAAAATASALALAQRGNAAVPARESDAEVLGRTLKVEILLVVAYHQVLASGALKPAVVPQVREILGQELEHVATLQRELKRTGAPVPAAPRDLVAAQRALAAHHVSTSLQGLRTQNDCLKLLIDVESLAEGAYFDAIGKLTDASLLRASGEMMGCEAQHWTVLSAIRHPGEVFFSVPYPFVQGST